MKILPNTTLYPYSLINFGKLSNTKRLAESFPGGKGMPTIALVQPKGGVGKSTSPSFSGPSSP